MGGRFLVQEELKRFNKIYPPEINDDKWDYYLPIINDDEHYVLNIRFDDVSNWEKYLKDYELIFETTKLLNRRSLRTDFSFQIVGEGIVEGNGVMKGLYHELSRPVLELFSYFIDQKTFLIQYSVGDLHLAKSFLRKLNSKEVASTEQISSLERMIAPEPAGFRDYVVEELHKSQFKICAHFFYCYLKFISDVKNYHHC